MKPIMDETTAVRRARTIEDLAARLRQPNPDPKLLEEAAEELEQLARDIRKTVP
jgi:hypothetical protein